MRWHVRVPLSIRPCLRSTLRACNISRADYRPPMAAAWQDAHTSVASRSEPSRAFEFPLLSAVFSSLFSFASEDDRDRKRRARARATLESMPLPLDLARRLRPKQSRTVVVSASSFGTGSFRRQRINALGSEAPWSDDSQENVARGRPWFSLARWFDFFSKRSDKPKGSLVVNEDFTRDAARRVGRLLSAEIDQAMFLLLPAAFYSYLLSVLLQMFWTEPEYFWYRWISENSVRERKGGKGWGAGWKRERGGEEMSGCTRGSEGACMHQGEGARGVQAALVSQLARVVSHLWRHSLLRTTESD